MTTRPLGTNLVEHPAVRAWAKLRPERPGPTGVVRLQKKGKGVVYRLEGAGPGSSNVIAKQSSPERIQRERAIYEQVLPALPVPTVRYHGSVEEPEEGCCWVFVEDAGGEDYSPLSAEHRALAGRWLGLLHTSAASLAAAARQPDRGPGYYLEHLRSARTTIPRNLTIPVLTPEGVALLEAVLRQCEVVASRWDEVERRCAGVPRTFIHGDFAPKNIHVRTGQSGSTLVPFDWGSAGWGVPAADLVQSGGVPSNYWASPDLAAYCSLTRGSWPHLDVQDLQPLAVLGRIFRCLVCIDLDAQGFAPEWVEKPLRNMRIYREQMADAIQAAGWED